LLLKIFQLARLWPVAQHVLLVFANPKFIKKIAVFLFLEVM
jgi:hypothetical protein